MSAIFKIFKFYWAFLLSLCLISSCSSPETTNQIKENPTATPTPTSLPAAVSTVIPENSSQCQGLKGEIEVKILVGPASSAGLEPLAVGSVPFSVISEEIPFQVEGSGNIDYQDVLAEEWGTYTVSMNMDMQIQGECVEDSNTPQLILKISGTGEQMTEINVGGNIQQYPWSGTNVIDANFPLQVGAISEGEGYSFVLIQLNH